VSPRIRDGSETRLASDRRRAVLGVLLWLGSLSAAAQEPVEPSPQPSASPRLLLPLKDREKNFVLELRRVRQYRAPSSAVWEALQGLVRSLGLRVEKVDPRGHLLVTSWQEVARQKANGLERQAFDGGGRADEFQLHLFVSPFVEPARIYVDAVARSRDWTQVRMQYSFEPVARWFFARLEERLGEEGRAVPFNSTRSSDPDSSPGSKSPCESSSSSPGTRPIQEPKALYKSQPLFPSKELARAGPVMVLVVARLGEDGAIQQVSVRGGPPEQMAAAAAHAVTLWRYEPLRLGGCPAPMVMTVTVRFSVR